MRFLNRSRLRRTRFESASARNNSRLRESIAGSTHGIRRAARRNRAGVIAVIAVGGLVALLTGLALAGTWTPVPNQGDDTTAGVRIPPRFGAATTFDLTNNETLIFGGFNTAGIPALPGQPIVPTARGDTWGFVRSFPIKYIDRNPVHSPSPRGFASMVYDAARRNVVLFGGAKYREPSSVSDETWIWNGSDWTLLHPPGARPPARQNASMVYDAHRKLVLMFGGRGLGPGQGSPIDDEGIWAWNGSTWKNLRVSGAPSPRHSAAMGYDLCRGQTVLFGGIGTVAAGSFAPAAAETWIWDGATWKQMPASVLPPARIGASMTYSGFSGRVLLYGGLSVSDTGQILPAADPDVWYWDGAKWEKDLSEVGTASAMSGLGFDGSSDQIPPPRAYASFVADATREKFTHLFGGTPTDSAALGNLAVQVAFGDQYMFEQDLTKRTGRTCVNPVPVPAAEAPAGGLIAGPPRKISTRPEIKEIGRIPVLLGTKPAPSGAPQPECRREDPYETVGSTRLATDAKRNRVYQFFICNKYAGYTKSGQLLIHVYDAKTLKLLKSVFAPTTSQYENPIFTGGSGSFQHSTLLHDADRGRFLLRFSQSPDLWVIRQDLIEQGVNPAVKIRPAGAGFAEGTILDASFFNHPKTGRAKLLVINGTTLSQLSLDDSIDEGDVISVDWSRTVENCSVLYGTMRIENRVYTSCPISGGAANQYAVVRIPVVEAADGSETAAGALEVFPGPFSAPSPNPAPTAWGDPQAERMLFLSNSAGGSALWVFDGKVSRYVGRSGLSQGSTSVVDWGSAFDQETGRFYLLAVDQKSRQSGGPVTEGGLMVLDTRLTPVPQPINFGQFSYTSAAHIGILPPEPGLPRRVFVWRAIGSIPTDPNDAAQVKHTSDSVVRYIDGEPVKLADEMYYRVLADELPVSEQPTFDQLDALTLPIAESAGKTEASFDAEGSGYGVRLRVVGGLSSGSSTTPVCLPPDRELMAGWVPQANLTDLVTSVRSLGLEVDSTSKTDLEGPSSRCLPPIGPYTFPPSQRAAADILWPLLPFTQIDSAVGPPLRWTEHFEEAECAGDYVTATANTPGTASQSASCMQKEARAEGSARGALTPAAATGAVSVGEGYSNVVVTRDLVKGVVVTSTAVAQGIRLGPISIDRVQTRAVSWSNGRPADESRAIFSREVCGVQTPEYSVPNGCLTSGQQKQFVDGLNQLLARRGGKAYFPTPDPNLLEGSSGGYIAGVSRLVADEEEEKLLLGRETQKEVPGLVITFVEDAESGPVRRTLELAAARAVTSFGLQCASDLVYSPLVKSCVALAFEDDPVVEEFEEEEDFSEDAELDSADGFWEPVEESAPEPLALGKSIGRFIQSLPIIRLLPIREVGEALLAFPVWLLLGLPLLLASRRFALDQAQRGS